MSGMEMLLINTLKAFMPKESAEKIAGWASDGTFDKIGNLPEEISEIKRQQAAILLALGRIFAVLQSGDDNGLSRNAVGHGPVPALLTECGPLGGGSGDSDASSRTDIGNVGHAAAAE